MPTLLQINVTVNTGSTGRIAEEIGQHAIKAGWKSYIAYGRTARESQSEVIHIGSPMDERIHGVQTLLFDKHGFSSTNATKEFVQRIDEIKPDVILFHNLHGYYINVEVLFDYLKDKNIPVYWTLHDCWPFTGHCTYFDAVNCMKWKTGCNSCNHYGAYPKTLFDFTKRNYNRKQQVFTQLKDITFVPVCKWMEGIQKDSFMKDYPSKVIYNGTDTDVFKPQDDMTLSSLRTKYGLEGKKVVLGVASIWDKRKGLDDFKEVAKSLKETYRIVLVGLNQKQIATLPSNIICIGRTENVQQLAALYSLADVFANPTYVDNFPTTNIEALACGTPVVTYRTGGSPEAVDEFTGVVVDKGNTDTLKACIEMVVESGYYKNEMCRKRALDCFNKEDRFADYINMFNEKISK